jgi:peroxiredoxin
MKKLLSTALATLALVIAIPAIAASVGEPAPDFTDTDTNGVTHTLSDFEGKTVVLEWTNHECPYVVKHYKSGNMQSLQEKWTDQGVVWIRVNSGAPGNQGHLTAEQSNTLASEQNVAASATILDESGEIGRAYDAKTTPHMYVINPEGTLVYAGAIDSINSADPADIDDATNYVDQALQAVMNNQPIETATTRAYGCSVKYAG